MKSIQCVSILLSTVALGAIPAAAQEAASDANATQNASAFGEIVVTANKRSENLSKVGASVTAITGEALQERQIVSLSDLATVVPGLQYAASTSNTPIFTLRGIGFNENSLGVYPAVSVYIDQAPLPFPVMGSHSAYDLERVEVLKGPQGTLFGQNSTGGAVNYIAAKPTKEFSAGGDLTYGRFNQVTANMFVSGPLSDTLAVRVAATGLRMDPWQRSVTRPDDRNGKQEYYAGRFLADWKPTESASFLLNVNGWVDRSEPQAFQIVAKRPVDPINRPPKPIYLNAPLIVGNARDADWTYIRQDKADGIYKDWSPRQNRRFLQASLRGDIDVTDNITLTSLTTYDWLKQTQATDADGTAGINFNNSNDGKLTSFLQEIRLANAPTNVFRWIVGGNYESSKTNEVLKNRYQDDEASNPKLLDINGAATDNRQKMTNYAAFVNAEYDLTEKLKVIAGLRYTNSKIDGYSCSFAEPGWNLNTLFNAVGAQLGTVPFTPVGTGPGQCLALDEVTRTPGKPFEQILKEDNVSWRAGLNYQVTPYTLIYGSVSRGYKAGSFPTLASTQQAGFQPVTQESVTAYELGFKTRTADGLVALNAAAFYSDYKDKQVKGKVLLTPNFFGPVAKLVNVPKSRIFGFEADLTLRPARGLTLTAAGTYINSKITKYEGYNINGAFLDFDGAPLPYTPKWSGSFDAEYRHEMAGGSPFVGLTVKGRTSMDSDIGAGGIVFETDLPGRQLAPGIGSPYVVPGYVIADGRLGYESNDGWKAYIWGKNIFDRYYITTVISGSNSAARAAGMPATYGVTVAFKM